MSAKVNIDRRYKTPKAVLRATLRLFEESPSNWTRHMRRRDRKSANGGAAFCATGAIANFSDNSVTDEKARRLLRAALPGNRRAITETNDRDGLKTILAGLKDAVA